jgi:hypothetical protein
MSDLASGQVILRLLGTEVATPVQSSETWTSPHTGRSLARIVVEVVVVGAGRVEEFSLALQSASSGDSPIEDTEGRRWNVSNRSERYTNQGPHTFSITLDETESLAVDRLEIDGLSFVPDAYEETFDGDAIVIKVRTNLTEEEAAGFRAIFEGDRASTDTRYFPVVRHGLQEAPRAMRLGRTIWQMRPDGIEVKVTLVEEPYDAANPPSFGSFMDSPRDAHVTKMAAVTEDRFEALLDELAGVLDSAALARVRSAGDGAVLRRQWAMAEVWDLDEWS